MDSGGGHRMDILCLFRPVSSQGYDVGIIKGSHTCRRVRYDREWQPVAHRSVRRPQLHVHITQRTAKKVPNKVLIIVFLLMSNFLVAGFPEKAIYSFCELVESRLCTSSRLLAERIAASNWTGGSPL